MDGIHGTTRARSGHPTSPLSAPALMPVLLGGHLRYDCTNPKNPTTTTLSSSGGGPGSHNA
jgi:transketolase